MAGENLPDGYFNPLRIECAGSPCLPWTNLGVRQGTKSPFHLPFLIWAAKMRIVLPSIIIHECTPGFPVEEMEYWFEEKYNISSFITDPTFIGHCTNRRRKFTWCIRKDLEFSGSVDEFKVIFDAYTIATGSIFYCAPDGYLQTSLSALCIKHGCVPRSLREVQDWSIYNPAGAAERVRSHLRLWMEKNHKIVKGKRLSLGEEKDMFEEGARLNIIADVEQNAGFGPSADTLVPTLVGHGLLHHYRFLRPLIGLEHLVAMGYPIFHRLHNQEFPLLNTLKHAITESQAKKLAGNAMYLPLMGLQLGYIVAKTRKPGPVEAGSGTPRNQILRRSSWSFSEGHGVRSSPGFSSPEMIGLESGNSPAVPGSSSNARASVRD